MSNSEFPTRARVVIIGGGVIGASVAYHFGKLGWTDTVLLERHQLTAGTTWHAAGLIVAGGMTTDTLAWMTKYSLDLYKVLEQETGLSTGFRQTGYLQIASSPERLNKLRRETDFLTIMGLERHEVSPAEVKALWPQLDTSDVMAGFHAPTEGRADPANVAMSLAKGARMNGVRIIEGVSVTDVMTDGNRVTGVVTDHGTIEAEYVVNCAGMWAREVGAMAGVSIPLQATEHAYLITEPFKGISPDQPILEDPDRFAYYREEVGGLMIGLFEPLGAVWSLDKVPDSFSFGEIPSDWVRLEPFIATAMESMPGIEEIGVRKLFTGPESFTPDNGFIVGESPELDNFFIAAGMNSLGILTGGGVGSVIANWIADGIAPIDITDVDPARFWPWQTSRAYLGDRSPELLGRLFATGSWPHSSPKTARNVRRSPLHDRLDAAGAHFSEHAGFELAAWFGPPEAHADETLGYGRHAWFEHHAAEHHAIRNGVGVFDMSAMSKFLVQGPRAEQVLNHLSGNNLAVPVGRCVYTQWMNEAGGVDADLTITRTGSEEFFVVVAEAFHRRLVSMLRRGIGGQDGVAVTDVSAGWGILSVQGPESRNLLSKITTADLSNEAFPYFTGQQIDMHYARGWAFRMSFVGELGWELYVPSDMIVGVYDRLMEVGGEFGLINAGMETLESGRMEAGRRDHGLDMENSDSPLEAGLAFALDFDKPGGFVGRGALVKQREARPYKNRLVQFLLTDPEPLLFGEEPIRRNGESVGYIRSGSYGHTLGGAVGMGYVSNDSGVTNDFIKDGSFEIQVASEWFEATASLRPLYDPTNQRVRM